jgi:hypothetical protein
VRLGLLEDAIYGTLVFFVWVLLEPIILEPIIGPALRYRYTLRKRVVKYATNHKVRVELISKSQDISVMHASLDKVVGAVAESLRSVAKVEQSDTSVAVHQIIYGGLEASGKVDFSIRLKTEPITVDGIQITLEADCKYRQFSDQVLELSRCVEQLKDAIRSGLHAHVEFEEFLGAKLNHIYELTGILSDLRMDYMNLGGEIDLTLAQKEATITKAPFSSKSIDTLRHLAVLYS